MNISEMRMRTFHLILKFLGLLFIGTIIIDILNIPCSFDVIASSHAQEAQSQPVPMKGREPSEGSSLGPLSLLFIIAAGGAFGGFVDGLRRDSSYEINFKNHKWQIGSIGDVLVGATAAVAIFTVADAIFKIDLDFQANASKEFVKLVAWSVLSGYVGPRLLNPLSEKLVRQLAVTAAREEVNKEVGTTEDSQIHIREGDEKLSKYDFLGGKKKFADSNFDMKEAKNLLEGASMSYELVLESNPLEKQALLGKSRVLRRQAEIADFEKDTKLRNSRWNEALTLLSQIISFAPEFPKAHYNLACYRVISGISKSDAQKSLSEAISLQPGLKAFAKNDLDLLSEHKEQWFKDIVG